MKTAGIIILAIVALVLVGCGTSGRGVALGLGQLLNTGKTYTYQSLPQNLEELKALPGADHKDPYAVAALTVAALARYESSVDDCIAMLDYLKGPEPVSGYEKQFIRERFEGGKYYKVMSFFKGSSPSNNYTPTRPYTITVKPNPYSFQQSGWCTLWLHSSGADNDRPVKLRQKPSTGEWFLNDIQFLSDIRTPAAQDKWY